MKLHTLIATLALAVAGTDSCVEEIVKMVEERRMPSLKASFVIRKLQSARVISEKMIEKIWVRLP